MTGRLWRSEVFQNAGFESWTELEDEPSSRAQYAELIHRCDAGAVHAQQTLFGAAALRMRSFTNEEQEKFERILKAEFQNMDWILITLKLFLRYLKKM